MRVLVFGVSGSGKTTVARMLASARRARFVDADDLHSTANKAKMAAGVSLTDDDRWPWLDRVASELSASENIVVACSALKLAYRDRIRSLAPGAVFVYLDGERDAIARRLKSREHEYMPASLLTSQFAALEAPRDDEGALRVSTALEPHVIVRTIERWIDSDADVSGAHPQHDSWE